MRDHNESVPSSHAATQYTVDCGPGWGFTIDCDGRRADNAPRASSSPACMPRSDGLPDFIIVGAQKGGTTSLQHHLRMHPRIEMAPNLVGVPSHEPQFFSRRVDNGLDWYRSLFNANGLFQGEKSPSYLRTHPSHALMRAIVPDCKLIAILRDPVERAESAFNHAIQLERAGSPRGLGWRDWRLDVPFRDNLDAYLEGRLSPGPIEDGRYIDHIESLLEHFPREQLLVLITEQYRLAPAQTLKQIFRFIGVADAVVPFNESVHTRPRVTWIDESTRDRLRAYYAPYNRRLFAYLGCDIPQWRT